MGLLRSTSNLDLFFMNDYNTSSIGKVNNIVQTKDEILLQKVLHSGIGITTLTVGQSSNPDSN